MPLTSSFESPSKEKRASLEKKMDMKSTSEHTDMDVNDCINVSGKRLEMSGEVMDSVISQKPVNTDQSSNSVVENSTKPAVDSSSETTQNDSVKLTVDSPNVGQEESTKPAVDVSLDSTNVDSVSESIQLDSTKSVEIAVEPEGENMSDKKYNKPGENKIEPLEVKCNTMDTNETAIKPKATEKADDNPVTMEKNEDQTTSTAEKPEDIGDSNPEDIGDSNPENMEVKETEQSKADDEEMCVDTPPRMPGRGKKRGRSSGATEDTPEAKKRAIKPEAKKRAIKSDVTNSKTERGRSSGATDDTPEAKKRAIKLDVTNSKPRVTHPTHPDVTIPGVPLTLGEGDVGQLGLGEDIIERGRPALVKLEDKIIQVVAGGMHTVCLTSQGKVYTFGCNDESALGRDTSKEGSETLPEKLNLPYKVIQMSGGDSHTAVLTEDGHVYAWGNFRDANGSMGLTSGGIRTEPLEMLPRETVVKIVSGGDHLVCLTDKGEIFTGGCAEQGQLGRVAECFAGRGGRKGVDSILKMGAVRCKKHSSRKRAQFTDIWAGQYVTFAKEKDTGDIYSWGLNNYFQLGFSDMQNRFVPERVPSFAAHKSQWVKVQAGQHHTMLLDEEGKVYTLGRAEYGRLGLGENSGEKTEATLVKRIEDKKIVDIAAGQSVSLALTDDGIAYSWGMGTSKQLGTGDEEDQWEPVIMKGKQLENRVVVSLSAGGQHTVLLAKDKS